MQKPLLNAYADESGEAYSLNVDVTINPGHQIGMRNKICFPYCSTKTYVVGAQKNRRFF